MKSINIKNAAFITVLVVITAVCFYLGIWQIDRYSQKQRLHDNASSVTEITVDELLEAKDYQAVVGNTVHIEGEFLPGTVFKLDNRMLDAVYGVDIFSLFREKSSARVYLVNMGWLQVGNLRDRLNRQFNFSGIHSLQAAIARIPSKPPFVDSDDFRDDKLKDLWLFVNKEYLEKQYAVTVESLILHNMKPTDDLKYRTDKKADNAIMHILYAIQWFLFSFFALFGLIKLFK